MKALQSPLVSTAVGGVAFLLTWVFTLLAAAPSIRPAPPVLRDAQGVEVKPASFYPVESWLYLNPEADQLIRELKTEKEALAARAEDLNQLSARLKTERAELDQVTESVKKIQADIDQRLLEVKAEEVPNLKRLAKSYSAMTPAGAATILREQDDATVAKALSYMKDAENGPILEAIARLGPAEAQRAASLTEKLRLLRSAPAAKAKP